MQQASLSVKGIGSGSTSVKSLTLSGDSSVNKSLLATPGGIFYPSRPQTPRMDTLQAGGCLFQLCMYAKLCKLQFSAVLSLLKSTMPSNSIFFDIQLPSLLTSIESKWKRAKTREKLPAYVHYSLKFGYQSDCKFLHWYFLVFHSIPTPTPTINFVTISEPQSPSSQQGWFLFQKSQVHTGRNHWPGIKSASLRVT